MTDITVTQIPIRTRSGRQTHLRCGHCQPDRRCHWHGGTLTDRRARKRTRTKKAT